MKDKYINDIEPMILNWLKSGNENTTMIAYEIAEYIREQVKLCSIPNVSKSYSAKNTDTGYELIPMNEIEDEAREIAVRWHENATDWIGDKHKLASDIMNYAKKQVSKACGG